MVFFDPKTKIMINLSARCGATVCTKMFLRHVGLLEQALAYHPWVHRYCSEVYMKRVPWEYRHWRDRSIFKFKVVRNPYDRAVSSFFAAMRNPEVRAGLPVKVSDLSFRQFVDALVHLDIRNCDSHFKLQKLPAEDLIPRCFNAYCQLELLHTGIDDINRRTGAGFSFTDLSSTHHLIRKPELQVPVMDWPWSRFDAGIPANRYFYDRECRDKIFHIYRQDFKAYGYSRSYGE